MTTDPQSDPIERVANRRITITEKDLRRWENSLKRAATDWEMALAVFNSTKRLIKEFRILMHENKMLRAKLGEAANG